jgi:hypothetical protein
MSNSDVFQEKLNRIRSGYKTDEIEKAGYGNYADNAKNRKAGNVGKRFGKPGAHIDHVQTVMTGLEIEEHYLKNKPSEEWDKYDHGNFKELQKKFNDSYGNGKSGKDAKLDKMARGFSEEELNHAKSSSPHEHHRMAAHRELQRRQKDEQPTDEMEDPFGDSKGKIKKSELEELGDIAKSDIDYAFQNSLIINKSGKEIKAKAKILLEDCNSILSDLKLQILICRAKVGSYPMDEPYHYKSDMDNNKYSGHYHLLYRYSYDQKYPSDMKSETMSDGYNDKPSDADNMSKEYKDIMSTHNEYVGNYRDALDDIIVLNVMLKNLKDSEKYPLTLSQLGKLGFDSNDKLSKAMGELGIIEKAHKYTKAEADYKVDPKGGSLCGNCAHFDKPHACDIVKGNINPEDSCKYYEAMEKGETDELSKAYEELGIKKGGEGSRGGKIVGHTKSGKPIYHNPFAGGKAKEKHKDWSKKDHLDAAQHHREKTNDESLGYQKNMAHMQARDWHKDQAKVASNGKQKTKISHVNETLDKHGSHSETPTISKNVLEKTKKKLEKRMDTLDSRASSVKGRQEMKEHGDALGVVKEHIAHHEKKMGNSEKSENDDLSKALSVLGIIEKGDKPVKKKGEPITITHNKTGKQITGHWRTMRGSKIFVSSDGKLQIGPEHVKEHVSGASKKAAKEVKPFYSTMRGGDITKKESLELIKNPIEGKVENVSINGKPHWVAKIKGQWNVIDPKTGHQIHSAAIVKIDNTKAQAIRTAEENLNGGKKADKSKPILEKDVKSFAKQPHEKKDFYKKLKGDAKKFVDDLHKMVAIPKDKLTSKEVDGLEEMFQGIYNNLPILEDPNEKYKSGGDMYTKEDKKDIKESKRVFGGAEVLNISQIRDIASSIDLNKYMNIEDDHKVIADLAKKYHVGISPKQTRLFKALETLGINNA